TPARTLGDQFRHGDGLQGDRAIRLLLDDAAAIAAEAARAESAGHSTGEAAAQPHLAHHTGSAAAQPPITAGAAGHRRSHHAGAATVAARPTRKAAAYSA